MKIIFVLLMIFPLGSFASNLLHISKDGNQNTAETIRSIRIINNGFSMIEIKGEYLSCELQTNSAEEAFKIQEALLSKKLTEIQCYGNLESVGAAGTAKLVKTDKYNLVTWLSF